MHRMCFRVLGSSVSVLWPYGKATLEMRNLQITGGIEEEENREAGRKAGRRGKCLPEGWQVSVASSEGMAAAGSVTRRWVCSSACPSAWDEQGQLEQRSLEFG